MAAVTVVLVLLTALLAGTLSVLVFIADYLREMVEFMREDHCRDVGR